MRTTIEFALGVAAAVAAWHVSGGWIAGQSHDVAQALAAVAGTMLGFIMAALAILASVGDHPFIKELRSRGHLKDLMSDLFWAALLFGAATLFGLTAVYFNGDSSAQLVSLATGAFIVASLRLVRGGQHFYSVMMLM
jgi:hypothetical protein